MREKIVEAAENAGELLSKIAEKIGFMKARTVKVCTKAMTESSPGHNNPSFLVNSRKIAVNALEKKNSDSLRRIWTILQHAVWRTVPKLLKQNRIE